MSSWRKPLSLADALHQLDSTSSVHRLYNALVVIRTNYSKGSESVTALRHHGGVEKLMNVLSRTIENKCLDVALSILGNCCMDEKCILRVLKSDDGIRTICNMVRNTEKESIRNRGCRVLANLCQKTACCDIIHEDHADVFASIVSNLAKATDKDSKITYCRTIRMLSDTEEHREAVLSHRALKPVAALLRSNDTTLLLSAMKTVSCFICNCLEEATRQLVSEGALESIVALTTQNDSHDIVSAAESLLLSIASDAPSLRPYLGRAGAVEYFIHQLEVVVTSDGMSLHKYRITNALCHCCRDANNRIRIREQGGLSVLTDLLRNSKLTNIHDRIISALVCFIYDDASIAVLLQTCLVSTLVSHLYRVAGVTNKLDFVGLDSFDVCESLQTDQTATTEDLDDALVCCNDMKSVDDQPTSFPPDMDAVSGCEPSSAEDTSVLTTDELNTENSRCMQQFALRFTDDAPVISEPNAVDVCARTPRYSIDSPTYKAVSAWRMELAVDEVEDGVHDRCGPRNIWEGARLYADSFSALSPLHSGSVSPARSLSSCSDGLCSVQSWTSSLCDSSLQRSPVVSPAWSLDSSGSGKYSPFSNSSYVYLDGACSPSSLCDADEAQAMSLARGDCSDDNFSAAIESHTFDKQHRKPHQFSGPEAHSKSNVSVHLNESAVVTELVTDMSNCGQENGNAATSGECFSSIHIIVGDNNDSNASAAVGKSEAAVEEEINEQCSDEEFDVESFQRRRQDERRFSRLLDMAETMYASIETKPVSQLQKTRKRRHSSGSNTNLSVSARQKFQCCDVSPKICMTEARGTSDLVTSVAKDLRNSSTAIDTDDCAKTPQCLQIVGDSNCGDINFDKDSNASGDTSTCSLDNRNKSRVTERNILMLLSRISHSPETIAHVMNAGTICGLFDYVLFASNPLPAASRTLLRLSYSHHGFQRAILCMFPTHTVWRMERDWLISSKVSSPLSNTSGISCGRQTNLHVDADSVDPISESGKSQSCMQKINGSSETTEIISKSKKEFASSTHDDSSGVISVEGEKERECVLSKLCDEIIGNLSAVAISGYGQGVVSHLLLRGTDTQRQRCIISLCFLCRNNEMRAKFLVDMHGVDVLMQLIQTPKSPLFPCAVQALSHQARCLQLTNSAGTVLTECHAVDAIIDRDLVFVLDDGLQVEASRCIMSRSSDVFAAMLAGGFRESAQHKIRIPAAESGAFCTMVAWLHGQTTHAAVEGGPCPQLDELCELLPLFHRFQIPETVQRRCLLAPLISAVFDIDEFEDRFAYVYRLLSVYDDVGGMRQEYAVSVFTRQMSLQRRCAAVTSVMTAEAGCDIEEFVSIITVAFLDAID